ncbi:MAG: PilZ domain-containing protein [Hyphomonadaceae bacterium]|nr:PilZ domain-containing protein [Hyphomonadaceae bacterium]
MSERLKAIADRKAPDAEAYESVSTSHRRPARVPTYKPAVIVLAGGEKFPVVIKNLSDTGAKVEFFQNRELSGQVRLVEQSIALNAAAEIAWQRGGVLGLTFKKSRNP